MSQCMNVEKKNKKTFDVSAVYMNSHNGEGYKYKAHGDVIEIIRKSECQAATI